MEAAADEAEGDVPLEDVGGEEGRVLHDLLQHKVHGFSVLRRVLVLLVCAVQAEQQNDGNLGKKRV